MWLSLAKTGLGGSGSPSFKMLEEKMSPQQIAKAQVLARKCFGSHYTDCGPGN